MSLTNYFCIFLEKSHAQNVGHFSYMPYSGAHIDAILFEYLSDVSLLTTVCTTQFQETFFQIPLFYKQGLHEQFHIVGTICSYYH